MNWASVFPHACGYERMGDQIRLYVERRRSAAEFQPAARRTVVVVPSLLR
jgi:hypothetical protein